MGLDFKVVPKILSVFPDSLLNAIENIQKVPSVDDSNVGISTGSSNTINFITPANSATGGSTRTTPSGLSQGLAGNSNSPGIGNSSPTIGQPNYNNPAERVLLDLCKSSLEQNFDIGVILNQRCSELGF